MFFYNESDNEVSYQVPVVSDPYFYNTSLLLKMDSDFSDSSVHQHTATTGGNVSISNSEFKYDGGSGYFDRNINTGVSFPSSDSFDLRDVDWTMEAWIKPDGDYSYYGMIIGKTNYYDTNDYLFYLAVNTGELRFWEEGAVDHIGAGVAPVANQWNHVAAVRKDGVITLYLNGEAKASGTKDIIYHRNAPLTIGNAALAGHPFSGYIDDARITKGVARYTANFTPPDSHPTIGPNEIVSTDLQLHFDAGDTNSYPGTGLIWYDLGPTNSDMVLTGQAYTQIDGVSTMYINGGHGNISYNSLFEIGNEDYAAELWIKTQDSLADLISAFNSSSPWTGWLFGIGFNNQYGKLALYKKGQSGANDEVYSSALVNDGLWKHVMFLKDGDTLKFFINGVLDSSHQLVSGPGAGSNQTIKIGEDNNPSPGRNYSGYMSELRIYKAANLTEGLIYQNFEVTKSRFGL